MKKIVWGICGVAVFCWGIGSLRNGALKADELVEQSVVVETATPDSSAAPAVVAPATPTEPQAEPPVETADTPVETNPEVSDGTAPDAVLVEQTPTENQAPAESEVEEITDVSVSDGSKNEPAASETSQSKESSSESSSISNSDNSTSQSSSTASSTPPPSESSTTSQPSTSGSIGSSSSSTFETTNSSSGFSPSETPEPSSSTEPFTPAPTPILPPETPAPSVSNKAQVQTSEVFTQEVPEAFSATSTLQLPSDLKTSEVAQSDLKGYELPLLASFENKAHAALIYDGIKKLGIKQEQGFNVEQLAAKLYEDLFEIEITGTPEKTKEEIEIGSLLYQKKNDQLEMVGIYIGKEYYLTVDDVEVVESAEGETEVTKEEATETEQLAASAKKEKQCQVVLEPMDLGDELFVQRLPDVTLTAYGQTVLSEYPASISFSENEGSKNFISKIAEDARKLGQEYDVFASVMIAQALLESGSGSSSLSLPPNHNLFGVKGTYQGQAVSMATQEDRGNGELYSINSAFRKYPNYAASLGDYVQLLRGGISGNAGYYQKTWRSTAKNYLRTTHALTGTYATDTSYGKKLNSIIAVYNLTQYDRPKVDQSSGIFIKGKEEIPSEYRTLMRYPDYNGVNYNTSGSYPAGQCTWYAFNRVKQLGKSVDDFMGNGGEWGTKGKALGYEVGREPKVGWLISFTPGTAGSDPRYGHVAFVEAVRPEGILISEGNVYGGNIISYRVIDASLAKSNLVTYIKAK